MQVQATHAAMGTEFLLVLHVSSEAMAAPLLRAALEEVDRIEALLSRFRPSSELARIVREAPFGPVTTDPETFALLQFAMHWSKRTAGAFDITVAPLLRAWGFDGPEVSAMDETAFTVGWQSVLLDPETRTIRFVEGQPLQLDLGAMGKGHAVDAVVALLREHGVKDALVSAGSSTIHALGAPPGEEGWMIHIPSPDNRRETISTLCLRDRSVSTSACTEHFVTRDGQRHGHLFDPRTRQPAAGGMRQTTVVAKSGIVSEVLSTSTFVMGPREGIALLREIGDTQALLIAEGDGGLAFHEVRWPSTVPALAYLR